MAASISAAHAAASAASAAAADPATVEGVDTAGAPTRWRPLKDTPLLVWRQTAVKRQDPFALLVVTAKLWSRQQRVSHVGNLLGAGQKHQDGSAEVTIAALA